MTSYYNYMVNVAVLLGAERSVAESELRESLKFEIELAQASQARENRRNATRLYNPYKIKGKKTAFIDDTVVLLSRFGYTCPHGSMAGLHQQYIDQGPGPSC